MCIHICICICRLINKSTELGTAGALLYSKLVKSSFSDEITTLSVAQTGLKSCIKYFLMVSLLTLAPSSTYELYLLTDGSGADAYAY